MIRGKDLARSGCKYIGTPYEKIDCQKLFEKMLEDCGLKMDLGGSNSWYRYILGHGWCGTPEECRKAFGCVPQGATLFIRKDVSDKTPEQFRDDDIGDISHMGVYTMMTGAEMIDIAEAAGVFDADVYDYGDGAIHSSSSRGHVCTSMFGGKNIPNGGWNRVGLLLVMICYDGIDVKPEPEPDPEPVTKKAVIWSENGGPVITRKGPGTSYPMSKAGRIPCGDVVEIIDGTMNSRQEEWCRVMWTDPRGVMWVCWVMAAFMKPADKTYTVTIQGLTSEMADEIVRAYPGAIKTAG